MNVSNLLLSSSIQSAAPVRPHRRAHVICSSLSRIFSSALSIIQSVGSQYFSGLQSQSRALERAATLASVAQAGSGLQDASDELRNDREIVLAVVARDGLELHYASAELKNDREIVLAAVAQYGHALKYASAELRNDREIVLAAVAKNGYALQYASAELRNDREIVFAAVAQNGYALQHASVELRNDRGFVLEAVAQNGNALLYASAELRNDREIVLAAVAQDGQALEYASDELRNDWEIVLAAVAQNGSAIQFASEALRNNADFIREANALIAGNNAQNLMPESFQAALALIDGEENKNTFIGFLNKLEEAPDKAQVESEVTFVAQMLKDLAAQEVPAEERDYAWEEVFKGSTACGDRARLHLKNLNCMGMLRSAETLPDAEKIIVGQFHAKRIQEIIATEFFHYSENIELALWAEITLHDALKFPGEKPAMKYEGCANAAFNMNLQARDQYVEALKTRILEESSKDRLEILVNSSNWNRIIKSNHKEAFVELTQNLEEAMSHLDPEEKGIVGEGLSEADYLEAMEQLKESYKGLDLVRQFTLEYLS